MKNITIKDVITITGGELILGKQDVVLENFSKDTRTIKQGDCYLGIKGTNFDGNLFWQDALEKGASTVIVENVDFTEEDKIKWKNKNIIKVKYTLEALYRIAKYKRSLYNIPVIAITGSVGKTSTKDIVASVVAKKYKTLKTIGNNNNNIGVPFTILRLKGEEVMVLEMGMNHFGEIDLLSKIAKPDICIITNIGTSHIGNLGSRENILKAKLEILNGAENPTIIINNDNDLLHNWYLENKNKYNIMTYGIENKSDMMAEDIKGNEYNSEFNCTVSGEMLEVKVPVAGEHFVLNSLCAMTVGKILDINNKEIIDGINSFELTKKRMDIINKNGIKIINDTYNASPESMKATLKYLSTFKNSRKIAVLGDMFELGKYSEKLHQDVGCEVFTNNIDILVCSGENSKYIMKKAVEEGMHKEDVYYFENKNDIIDFLKNNLKKEDVVLFKASNGMKFFDLVEKLEKEI